MDKPRKVYLLTQEQMDSIGTKLSAMSRYVDDANRRTLTIAITELNKAVSINERECLDGAVDKLMAAMKGGAK